MNTIAIDRIKKDEGFRGKPYLDTVGKTTIGYGRNLDDVPLTMEEAEYLLRNALEGIENRLKQEKYYSRLTRVRQSVVINMVYNLGYTRYTKFKNMIAALESENYEKAAIEMLDSKWAKQVGDRAQRLAQQMRKGF